MASLPDTNTLLNDLIEAVTATCSVVCVTVIAKEENVSEPSLGDSSSVARLRNLGSVQATLTDGLPRIENPPFDSLIPGAEFIAIEPLSLSNQVPETVIAFAGKDSNELDRSVALVHALASETASELLLFRCAPFLASGFAEADCGVTIADPKLTDTPLIYANAAFAHMTGYPRSELLGRNCRFLQGHLRDQASVQKIRNALARGTDCTAVVTNIRQDGRFFRNRLKLRPVRTGDGTLSHIIGIQVDVTAEHNALESLNRQRLRYESLIQTEDNYVWHMDSTGTLRHVSANWLALAGLSSLTQPPDPDAIRSVLTKEAAEAFRFHWKNALADITPFEVTYELLIDSRSSRWFVDRVSPVIDENGELQEWLAVSTDITELKRAEQNLQKIIDAAPTGMIVVDREGSIEIANTEAELQFGYSLEELTGMSVDALVPSSTRAQHSGMRAAFYENPSRRPMGPAREIEGVRKDDTRFPLEVGLNSFGEGDDFRVIAAFTDATEIRQARREIERAAYFDRLTGLLSSEGFAWHLNEHLKREKLHPASMVVVVDVRALREINNTRGYAVGDEVLGEVARRLQAEVGEQGLAARTGGDEFTVLIPIENRCSPSQRRKGLAAVFDVPFDIRGFPLHVEASFGYTRIQNNGSDALKLMNDAALSLHQSQRSSVQNWTQYTRALERQTRETVAMTEELRYAIEKGDLALYYQPKVDLLTGHIVAAEALLRWLHPNRGFIPPDQFIPLAEQSQLIGPIGDWVLREACRDLRASRDAGLPATPVSVNLSLIQFQLGNVPEKVSQALSDYEVAPDDLILEITESVFEQHSQTLRQDLQALSAIGVRLSLDDFGTGYSSLNHLKHYPFDKIKIDKSFVGQLHDDGYSAAIVKAVILIAKAINAEVIAEGIETAEQLETLRHLGCTTGQGYYFSRPVPEPSWREALLSKKAFA